MPAEVDEAMVNVQPVHKLVLADTNESSTSNLTEDVVSPGIQQSPPLPLQDHTDNILQDEKFINISGWFSVVILSCTTVTFMNYFYKL
jgi:hypothetical protein